uniref:C2H2-type domain-containing protein n=1 Tax=Moniliophthora roreri TaxID=221103 RepID=A0A0W0G364_MONRR
MSFALPIQLLSHCQLLITTATGSCNKKASFELRPLEFEKPGTSRPLPTSIYVRVIETPEGTVFELSGNDPPLATSPDQLATPSDYSLPPAYEADVRSNFDFENESYRGLDADIDRWINGLPTDGQRGYSALSFAELCTPEAAGFSDPPDGSSSSQVGYGDENGDNQGNSHTLPKKDVHYQTDAWGTAAIPSPLESIDQPDNSTTTSPGPSEHSSLDDDFSKKSDKGKRPTNSKKRQTQHRPRPFRCRHPDCDRVFTSNYTRETHMLTHRPKQRQSYQCTIGCGALFSRKHDRFRHEVSQHGKPTPWTCTHCSQYFASEKMLAVHRASCNQPMRLSWKPQKVVA